MVCVGSYANGLEKDCLACHQSQQIPSDLIYKRYLLKYSSHDTIKKVMFAYLKEPKKSHSIMPPQFFLKFPMKPKSSLLEDQLREDIGAYIDHFDIKKRLRLKE